MFRVKDGRDKRKCMIARYAVLEPYIGVLVAAADFEWTCRRSILALSKDPTAEIKEELFQKQRWGLKLAKAWEQKICQTKCSKIKFHEIFDVWAKENMSSYVLWADIEYAMMWRNRLIHGVENDIGESEGYDCVNILECANDILDAFVKEKGGDIYSMLRRGGEWNDEVKRMKAERINREKKKVNDGDDIVSKRSRRKDEIIVRGVRILKKHIRDEFNVNSSAVESIMMKIGRKYGVKLI